MNYIGYPKTKLDSFRAWPLSRRGSSRDWEIDPPRHVSTDNTVDVKKGRLDRRESGTFFIFRTNERGGEPERAGY